MNKENKRSVILVNLLIAVAISLIVNFSHFIFSLQGAPQGRMVRYVMHNPQLYITIQVVYWFALSFILLSISTSMGGRDEKRGFLSKVVYCTVFAAIAYLFTPVSNRSGEIIVMAAARHIINPMVMLKSTFTLIVALLYGKIYELIYQKHSIVIENEQLKNENLLTRYNMLMSQINPHFLFNSLNSLSMLVRGKHNDKALTYIDRLSDTFRYIIQSGQSELTTLSCEIEFLSGYKYLNEVRYADKLFIDIDIDPQYNDWQLPALSLQPLIENAVKHNIITLSKPFRISITAVEGELTVANPVRPKIEPEEGTGIGLKNLSSRFVLLTGRDITVEHTDDTFRVRLPLIKPRKQ